MKKLLFILLPVIIFTGIFISCDFLLPAPLGRNNPFDDEAQIGRFEASPSSYNSIVTVWEWRNPASGIDDSRIIDKVRIVYSENNPPVSKYPLNPDNVIEYTSNTDFSYEWTNLNENTDHYFALYAHEKGGLWLAPKNIKAWINDGGYFENWPWNNIKMYVNALLPANPVGTTATNIIYDPGVPEYVVGFMRFDDLFTGDYGAVVDARIQGWVVATGGTLSIIPVRKTVDDTMLWGDIDNPILYDYEHANTVIIGASTDIVDIKDQINISRVYGSNTLAFITSDTNVSIGIESLTFWDGSTDLFSIWRNNP